MAGERFPLPRGIAHQVSRVLRLHDGERLILLDGAGEQATCRLESGDCVVEERGAAGGEPTHRLSLILALLRGDHLEPVIRHATEIGVAGFRLMVSERCVARELSTRRLERLRDVAREAAEQSERGRIPSVIEPRPFGEVVPDLPSDAVLLFERGAGPGLTHLAAERLPSALVIGPEGGFSPGEAEVARTAGLRIGGLGVRILRSETAALSAVTIVLSAAGDFA
jgi:16S rRNA (uracil1498-N3)-methyltransferase